MLLARDALKSDLPELSRLAEALDTVNLPANERALASLLEVSTRSFAGRVRNPLERLYLFVLEDAQSGRIVGTSQIIAMHGTREAPHVFLDLYEREHYSATLDRHFKHSVMQIGYNYEGFTEIGGLVVDPASRGIDKPGKQLSFVRFLYMAMHRKGFRERVLAELLPPLLPDGRSLLWEAFGTRFTGLSYQEADKLSRRSKEFIKELFPSGEIYVELLPPEVQQALGKVGPATEGVRRMLEVIGFSYDHRIDPFDGGPHFSARLDDVTLVKGHRRAKVMNEAPQGATEDLLVAVERPRSRQRFRAVRAQGRVQGARIALPESVRAALKVDPGDGVHVIPFV
jgi:arginine N-succinyltransferase